MWDSLRSSLRSGKSWERIVSRGLRASSEGCASYLEEPSTRRFSNNEGHELFLSNLEVYNPLRGAGVKLGTKEVLDRSQGPMVGCKSPLAT